MSSDWMDTVTDHTCPCSFMAVAGASQCFTTAAPARIAANGERSRYTSPRITYPVSEHVLMSKEPAASIARKLLAYAACKTTWADMSRVSNVTEAATHRPGMAPGMDATPVTNPVLYLVPSSCCKTFAAMATSERMRKSLPMETSLLVPARNSASSPALVTPQWYLSVAKMSMERNPPRLFTARLAAACTSWPNMQGTGNTADA
mmetsp:Transcript_36413/g.89750  ORF Transcript_36413/g.89750 Transcript_36413/m.89750 type:complete len:204 (+) Transcript_36413:156-767(+)